MPCGHPASPDPESSDGTGRSPPDADLGLWFFSVLGLFERDSASQPRPLREPVDRVGVVDRPGPEFPEQPPLCEGRHSAPPGNWSAPSSQEVPFSFIPVHCSPVCSVAPFIAPRGRLHAGLQALLCRSWCCGLLEPQWLQAVTYHTWHSTAHNNCAPDIAGRVKAGTNCLCHIQTSDHLRLRMHAPLLFKRPALQSIWRGCCSHSPAPAACYSQGGLARRHTPPRNFLQHSVRATASTVPTLARSPVPQGSRPPGKHTVAGAFHPQGSRCVIL